jgi:ppGpp synthetase/RelA/SpoT-type nucleotidyltranferase
MNFDAYEKQHAALYAEFAGTIELILEKAIAGTGGIPRPQSIQCRAKSPASLKHKLEDRRLLESDSIETEIRDLAGARLIFYTNTDVDRFLNSRLIPENFQIDRDATRVHHPTKENEGRRYQAIHYTVSLNDDKAKLPEYAKFKGMRCEIQIQTILNHAWSETSHDILYKDKPRQGFGSKAMESISNRFSQIMDKYLLPAGFEFQRVQHDYERLQQGKELFDRDAIRSLEASKNNNERYELLSSLKEYTLPNYDDIPAIYGDLRGPLVDAAKASRSAPVEPIKTTFGDLEGRTAADVTNIIVDIFDTFRYADIERTFSALCEIYRDEPDPSVRKNILDSVKRLAHYDLDVWRQVGPGVQVALAGIIERMQADDRNALRPILITVWSEVLDSGITVTTWKADSIQLRSGALPVSDELRAVREKAMSGLFDLFAQSTTDAQKRQALSALREATRVPTQAGYSNELLALTLLDAKRIADFFTQHATEQPYELLEHVEHDFLYDYRIARGLAENEEDRFGCRQVAKDLMASIEVFRDKANSNETFVRYKTLVGFESVFPPHWLSENFDFGEAETYRLERATDYIGEISDATEAEWYTLIARCAATESDDLATFPVFGEFLYRLAKAKPAVASRYLDRADDRVLNFLPAFLNGLRDSGSQADYQSALTRHLTDGKHLIAIARHFQKTATLVVSSVKEVLEKAISSDDDIAVMECLVLAIERHDPEQYPLIEAVFVPAIVSLIGREEARWIHGAWFLEAGKTFFPALPADKADLVLDNLLALQKIEHHAERILVYIAQRHPEAVWRFFEQRLVRMREDKQERYEAFPYRFFGLEKPLGANPDLAVDSVRKSFKAEDPLFRFDGGRLLSTVFPACPESFANKLSDLAENGSDKDVSFVLGVLQNYKGEIEAHPALKALINRLPEGDPRFAQVEISLQNTGGVWGELGFVEAFRQKKTEMASWLDDQRPRVREFAAEYIGRLDQRIASEQRSAEQNSELRKRSFDADEEPDS